MENGAVVFKLTAQFQRIDKIPIVCKRHRALTVAHNKRLRIDGAYVSSG